MAKPARPTISGQSGPQTDFLRTPADICIYGGAAGGGKTVGLILEPLRHVGRIANFTTSCAALAGRTEPPLRYDLRKAKMGLVASTCCFKGRSSRRPAPYAGQNRPTAALAPQKDRRNRSE
jgi:hypothetical protein